MVQIQEGIIIQNLKSATVFDNFVVNFLEAKVKI